MQKPMSKLQRRVVEYLQEHASITVRECVNAIGTTELRKIVSDLRRKGVMIYDHEEKSTNRYGDTVRYKRYFIVPQEKETERL